jgi:hypothetical protein
MARRPLRVAGDGNVGVAAGDVGAAGLQGGGRDQFGHAQGAEAVEPIGQRAGEAGGHVLGDHDRPGEVGRQGGQQGLQRRRAASGGADEHEPGSGARHDPPGRLRLGLPGGADAVAHALAQPVAGADARAGRAAHARHDIGAPGLAVQWMASARLMTSSVFGNWRY